MIIPNVLGSVISTKTSTAPSQPRDDPYRDVGCWSWQWPDFGDLPFIYRGFSIAHFDCRRPEGIQYVYIIYIMIICVLKYTVVLKKHIRKGNTGHSAEKTGRNSA